MLSPDETRVLDAFRTYLMTPRQMLCFSGPDLQAKRPALESLAEKQMLTRETRDGAYSLTPAGYSEMNSAG